jgi:hypothetical protein
MQILTGMSGHSNRAWFRRVMILPVAATRSDEKPAVIFDPANYLADFTIAHAAFAANLFSKAAKRL